MQITNFEGLVLQQEINYVFEQAAETKTALGLKTRYYLQTLFEKVTKELTSFNKIREQTIKDNTKEDGTVDTPAVEALLNPISIEKIEVNYSIDINKVDNIPTYSGFKVLFQFITE